MGAFCLRNKAPSFTENKCSFVIVFFKTLALTSHLILLPVSEELRAGGIFSFFFLQLLELCDRAVFSSFPVITQPAGDGARMRNQII